MSQPFDAAAYWAAHEFKTWTVLLMARDRKARKDLRATLYVRARTQAGAVRTARENSSMPRSASAYARLATPQDLGCIPTPTQEAI